MRLAHLLETLTVYELIGSDARDVAHVTDDSRRVAPNDLYVAIRGLHADGHQFIPDAIARGATTVVVDHLPDDRTASVTYVIVPDTSDALGALASAFHGHPSRRMWVIGVTGTDGKTTTATLLHHIATAQGHKAGLLSTIRNVIVDEPLPATYTTPDALTLQATLAAMAQAGCVYVFMEVSSHASAQRRIAGMTFGGGVFTNLTHCHLDYHKTMDAYFAAKQQFFNMLPATSFALTNIDDAYGEAMVTYTAAAHRTYALDRPAEYRGTVVENTLSGLGLAVNATMIQTGLVGRFNAYNVTAAVAAADLLGFDPAQTVTALESMTPVEGRFDWIRARDGRIGVVDYAHTPHALVSVLQTARDVFPGRRISLVIGCQGAPHDTEKRPVMGHIASQADCAIFTNMNPRWEPPEHIFDAMLGGVAPDRRSIVRIVPDRAYAIREACDGAWPDGVVVVAGRGHVRYHQVRDTREPFYDKDVLRAALES